MAPLLLVLFCLLAAPLRAADAPDPELSPREVVEAQLAAFKQNDSPTPDAGIATAFEFASPANRKSTGPLERFTAMVHAPGYDVLLNHRQSSLEIVKMEGGEAHIKVHILDAKGEEAAFLWVLSKQREKPYKGCWMTDSVFRVDIGDSPFRIA